MEPLAAVLVLGFLMSLLALSGSVVLLFEEAVLRRLLVPMVALAAGSLIGGALFHMLPAALRGTGDDIAALSWVAAGFLAFLVLENLLQWHHCHRPPSEHRQSVTYLVLIADGLHNLLGGLAIGAILMMDVRAGFVAWLAAAAHELPQEIGDFGILVHGGWSKGRALLFNFLSALTFPLGALAAYAGLAGLAGPELVAFGAGNFLYIGATDLIPEVRRSGGRASVIGTLCFALGLGGMLLLRLLFSVS